MIGLSKNKYHFDPGVANRGCETLYIRARGSQKSKHIVQHQSPSFHHETELGKAQNKILKMQHEKEESVGNFNLLVDKYKCLKKNSINPSSQFISKGCIIGNSKIKSLFRNDTGRLGTNQT